jgi:hypothetical protein
LFILRERKILLVVAALLAMAAFAIAVVTVVRIPQH